MAKGLKFGRQLLDTGSGRVSSSTIRVTVWGENVHERTQLRSAVPSPPSPRANLLYG